MAKFANRFPYQLSGGERQRVAVSRALASNAKLILADEPTASLDSKNASKLLALIHEINKSLGVTFLFSTHDPKLYESGLRVLSIRDGRLQTT